MNEGIKEQVTVIHINAHFSHTQRGGGRTGDRQTLKRLRPDCEHSELTKVRLSTNINPFTSPPCKISGLKDARRRMQTV